ncbi:hypothetical protein C8Q70DRAFT_948838 [Cubamyces menziesii]|nr:hypothetical protein C8Q70DRAFT_948838 [Cubamyces menziesii]
MVRTSKLFRDFLLSKRCSRFIWRDAWKGVEGFPVLPPLLSEPALAHLLYSLHCHGCGERTMKRVIFQWQKRYCKVCLKSRREEWRLWYAGHPLSQDEFFSKLGGFCYSIFNDPSDGTRWFQIEQYERFLIAWHAAEPNLEAKRQVYEMQIAKKREIADYAAALSSWVDVERQARLSDLHAMKEQRFQDVCSRLRDEGWSAELDHLMSQHCDRRRFERISSIRQASQLTDRAFQRVFIDIEPILREARGFLVAQRKTRLDNLLARLEELEAAIEHHYFFHDSGLPCIPSAFDFVCDPEVEPLLRAPSTLEVSSATFARVLPFAISRRETKFRSEFGKIVKANVESVPDNIDPIELAVASFRCLNCDAQPLRYPAILAHPCGHASTSWPDAPQDYNEDLREVWSQHWDSHGSRRLVGRSHPLAPENPFGMSCWEGDTLSSPKALLAVLNLPPEIARLEDVQYFRLVCLSCSLGKGALTWEAALAHTNECHDGGWRVASEEERYISMELEVNAYAFFPTYVPATRMTINRR